MKQGTTCTIGLGLLLAMFAAGTSARTHEESATGDLRHIHAYAHENDDDDDERTALFPVPFKDIIPIRKDNPLSLSATIEYSLRRDFMSSTGRQALRATSPVAVLGLRYNPYSAWFINVSLRGYLAPEHRKPWEPDFTYAFGYDDWRANTHSLIYANSGSGNRLWPERSRREGLTRLGQGTLAYGYKFQLDSPLAADGSPFEDDTVNCAANARLTMRYKDHQSGGTRPLKKALSLGCRYNTPSRLFAGVTLFAYPQPGQQQPWDPDFTYSFGYADPRAGGISIQYGNDSGNRFPGRTRAAGQGQFRNGTVSLTWSMPFG